MTSLATRITVAVVGITAGTVLVASAAMWWTLRTARHADVDHDLDGRAERVRRFDGMGGRWRGPRPPDGRGGPPRLMQILAPDGATLGAEPETPLRPPGPPPADGWRGTVGQVRVLAVTVKNPPAGVDRAEGGAIVLVGEDLTALNAEMRRMAMALGVLWLVATALAVAAAMGLRRAVLRPLAVLDADLARLRADDLSARLAIGSAPPEVRTLVARLNTLLDGLEQAFKREQATIANIAHELRTPVAGLRTEIEFRQLASTDAGEQAVLRGLLATVGRMQAMVGNILMLARIEAGRERLAAEAVDLVPLAAAAVERWEARAAGRGQEMDCIFPEASLVTGSAVHLDVMLDNLLGNAVSHGDAGVITVRIDGSVLRVANPCQAAIDVAQLGTAFYRADESRSDGAHCGLGLALCRRIAGLLGAKLELAVADREFSATLTMTGR